MDAGADAYGQLVLDYVEGRPAQEIVERDDGLIEANKGPLTYFVPPRRWPAVERQALRWARGRCLDVGVGAGRVALELQRRGHEVVGIDVSPLAVEVARRRGVREARVLPFEEVDERVGSIDTVVMYGNNFGLFGSRAGARRLMRRLARLTSDRGRILGCSLDPYRTDDPAHLAYQERNRRRGRMPGQLRIRIRHRTTATPWMSYLIVSPDEMAELADAGGWRVRRFVQDDGPLYVGVLDRA